MPETASHYADASEMYAAHAIFRREFALLPGLVRSVPPQDDERAGVIAGHIRLMTSLLHIHLSAEDVVLWPRLLARAPKETDPVVHLVEGHHEGIEDLLAETCLLLSAWNDSTAGDDREALAETLQRLAVALFEHLGLEEKLILPVIERHIFASEWNEMVDLVAASLSPDIGPLVMGMHMYESGLDGVPEALQEALADAAPQAYAAHCERVHGTQAPPRSTEVVIGTPFVGVADRVMT